MKKAKEDWIGAQCEEIETCLNKNNSKRDCTDIAQMLFCIRNMAAARLLSDFMPSAEAY